MARYYPPHQTPVVVTDNDVLCGRGVNIAAHPGNERFRTLVTTRADDNYCEAYSVTEKKALAEEIVRHINSLDPPGRFLKREGRGQVTRGLNGPWEELSHREAVKKTCQALRDCNRTDRETYASGVKAPADVEKIMKERAESGLTGKDFAAKAAEELKVEYQQKLKQAMEEAGVPSDQIEEQLKRQKADPTYVVPGFTLTADGTYQPIAVRPPEVQVGIAIGPDGMPIPAADPIMAATMPVMFSQFPHPAVEMAPIDEEAQAAARLAAGYIHPSERAAKAAEAEEAVAAAAEEAAAAVDALDSAETAQQELAQQAAAAAMPEEAQQAAELAVAIAQDAVNALTESVKVETGEEGNGEEKKVEGDADGVKVEGTADAVKVEATADSVKAEGAAEAVDALKEGEEIHV